jgi:hypothetical protein
MLGMDDQKATEFAATHIGPFINDLVAARQTNFDVNTPLDGIFDVDTLKFEHQRMVDNSDTLRLGQPLQGGRYSDRWVFKVGKGLDNLSRQFGIVGNWEMPFIKTFTNAVQYGIDSTPLINFASPYNRAVMRGEYGTAARNNLTGRTLIGMALGAAGIGAANGGLLSPLAGSKQAQKIERQLSHETLNTLRIGNPLSPDESVVLDFRKGTPLVDNLFLTGKMWQIGQSAWNQEISAGDALVASALSLGDSFGTQGMMRGVGVSLDSFLNPTYSTADNLYRNVVINMAAPFTLPGMRAWDNVTRFTDDTYRDFTTTGNFAEDTRNYALSKLPGWSNLQSPSYDMWGNARPRNDYVGATEDSAVNVTRLLTPVGIHLVPHDKVLEEMKRFGAQGLTVQAPIKQQLVDGVLVPLDQFRDAEGRSLWDEYNDAFASVKIDDRISPGKKVTVRDAMNQFISSPEYADLSDSAVTRLNAGVQQRWVGSRWSQLAGYYLDGKQKAYNHLFKNYEDPSLNDHIYNDFRNPAGMSLQEVIERTKRLVGQKPNEPFGGGLGNGNHQ